MICAIHLKKYTVIMRIKGKHVDGYYANYKLSLVVICHYFKMRAEYLQQLFAAHELLCVSR